MLEEGKSSCAWQNIKTNSPLAKKMEQASNLKEKCLANMRVKVKLLKRSFRSNEKSINNIAEEHEKLKKYTFNGISQSQLGPANEKSGI